MPRDYKLSGFVKLHWYALRKLSRELKVANREKKKFHPRKLDALKAIHNFLKREKKKKDFDTRKGPISYTKYLLFQLIKNAKFRPNEVTFPKQWHQIVF